MAAKVNLVEMHSDIQVIKTQVNLMYKAINGNGQPGLIQRVSKLENWRYYTMGAIVIAVFVIEISLKLI